MTTPTRRRPGRPVKPAGERLQRGMIALRPDEWSQLAAVPGDSRRDKVLRLLATWARVQEEER